MRRGRGGHAPLSGRLHHTGIGRAYAGARIMLLIAKAEVRVITTACEFLGAAWWLTPPGTTNDCRKDLPGSARCFPLH